MNIQDGKKCAAMTVNALYKNKFRTTRIRSEVRKQINFLPAKSIKNLGTFMPTPTKHSLTVF